MTSQVQQVLRPPADQHLADHLKAGSVGAAEPGEMLRDVRAVITGQIVDSVDAAVGLEGAMDAILVDLVELVPGERRDLSSIKTRLEVANAEVDAADPRQHPGFVRR